VWARRALNRRKRRFPARAVTTLVTMKMLSSVFFGTNADQVTVL
jgi:hypothetical protein